MFSKIQHVGYQVHDLDSAVSWFGEKFGGQRVAGGGAQLGGRNAFVRFGQIEVELLEPARHAEIPPSTLQMHHVGYVVPDIQQAAAEFRNRGLKFASDGPVVNPLDHQVWWLDPSTTNDALIHLTQLPEHPNTTGVGEGLQIDRIIHAGYLVDDLDAAVSWYIDTFDGTYIGGGMSRRGVNNAFVNFGQVQVELLEPTHRDQLQGRRHILDHVGYVVRDIVASIGECQRRGLQLGEAGPRSNTINQLLCYFDTPCTLGTQIHLTQLPD
jgi:catechol 2,3-dioxygenase-like lactoylglutathione lyase family enzyme